MFVADLVLRKWNLAVSDKVGTRVAGIMYCQRIGYTRRTTYRSDRCVLAAMIFTKAGKLNCRGRWDVDVGKISVLFWWPTVPPTALSNHPSAA